MSTHNIRFYEDLKKISFNYHQISSNTHLLSSSDPNVKGKPVFEVINQPRHKSIC